MTDPNKLTLLTPGFDRTTGAYVEHGIPARSSRNICAKTASFREERPQLPALPAHPLGSRASKAGTLISGLVASEAA